MVLRVVDLHQSNNRMDYKTILLEKINNLTNGTWSVLEFEKEYYQYFLDQVPGNAMNTIETEFFSLVQEKLDWTAENPDEQDKKYGYYDYLEYIAWLKKNTQEFLEDENAWYQNYLSTFKK